ncbi:MAG: 50S ribosomal protein L28 [Candidatus Paceibacterota bacterium]
MLVSRVMKTCPICNKGSIMVGGYSNRVRATKYNRIPVQRKQPNLQWAKTADGTRIKICTQCLKGGKNLLVKTK